MHYIDQLGNHLLLPKTPERIISLVPSQTAFLVDLGLAAQLIGITKFCLHPKDFFKKMTKNGGIIGGTKQFNFEKIDALQPDLIIGNKEENYQAGILQLQQKYPVWLSDIFTLSDSYNMMLQLGEITAKQAEAQKIVTTIQNSVLALKDKQKSATFPKVLYLIWQQPYMAVGTSTFINEMLHLAGFSNVLESKNLESKNLESKNLESKNITLNNPNRYPEISEVAITALKPDLIFLSSEPYPFKAKHIAILQNLVPNSKILLVDGELFSWYGSRLQQSTIYFENLQKEINY
jgi:ABC-type Fe3+-hydroxamate transport system substrate-binding protein